MFINVNASPTDWVRDDITSSSNGVTGMPARNAVANWSSTIRWNGVNTMDQRSGYPRKTDSAAPIRI